MGDDPEITEIEGIGQLLEKFRTGKGLSRAKLAELSSVPAISISKYEKAGQPDGQYPPIKKLAKLALALEIDGNLLIANCLDTEEEREQWWGTHQEEGVNFLAKIFMSALAENKSEARKLGDFLAKAANEKPEEASLATSSPGSEPKPNPHVKENEDGST